MSLQKRLSVIFLLICLAGTAFALDIKWKGVETIDPRLDAEAKKIVDDLEDEIGDIQDNPQDLIKGFADSSVFASTAATQRAYGEYRLWALTVGPMVGVRLPSGPRDFMDDIEDLGDRLEEEGDIKLGLNVQAAFQLGINTSGFLLDGLYLGLRVGYLNISPVDDMDFKILHIGPVAHYQLLKGVDHGAFRWRGVTVGTGFLFQKTTLSYQHEIGDRFESGEGAFAVYTSAPNLAFDMDITTFTIPIELNTSIQLLWFLNLNAGVGADFAFGKNTTSLTMSSDVYADVNDERQGRITVEGGGSQSPTVFNPKVMANLGFKLGPVVLDVPVTYYFIGGHGLSVGLTLGAVW